MIMIISSLLQASDFSHKKANKTASENLKSKGEQNKTKLC